MTFQTGERPCQPTAKYVCHISVLGQHTVLTAAEGQLEATASVGCTSNDPLGRGPWCFGSHQSSCPDTWPPPKKKEDKEHKDLNTSHTHRQPHPSHLPLQTQQPGKACNRLGLGHSLRNSDTVWEIQKLLMTKSCNSCNNIESFLLKGLCSAYLGMLYLPSSTRPEALQSCWFIYAEIMSYI